MTAPAGAEVGLYVDLVAQVQVGDVLETRSGRRYGVVSVRVQARGKHAGRQHLRAVVIAEDERAVIAAGDYSAGGARIHRIRWYARRRWSGSVGVAPRGRP